LKIATRLEMPSVLIYKAEYVSEWVSDCVFVTDKLRNLMAYPHV